MNDVVLAVVGGALRRWLQARGELPGGSLVAGVPSAPTRPAAGPRLGGNRVSNIFTSLATDIDDPRERLRAISRTTGGVQAGAADAGRRTCSSTGCSSPRRRRSAR